VEVGQSERGGSYGTDVAQVVLVGLVDGRGQVLLQERDSQAPVDPDRWSLPGGGVEPGESDAEAASRELFEETGLRDRLTPLGSYLLPCAVHGKDDVALFGAPTSATDADIVLGEGRQIVFVDPARFDSLDLAGASRALLPMVLTHPALVVG
jgi:8-oxo-dGTP diphosphatase